jgi:hypothetical protein
VFGLKYNVLEERRCACSQKTLITFTEIIKKEEEEEEER